eukprot:CAMPEP_0204385716 /NCGR_PEP_ID=MMETSP0469-20131031/57896_1 /ASSEMBLY_ACC=CAM_ASM_000384 /TAXON_ID=2969 /ORGANISM="Oxyrrhis marina" /LENGTH=53 /DNA_ID=CAMNT_0051378753 /DNA_START=36 /DNA_END=195 /DNA_ORIENTATION=-
MTAANVTKNGKKLQGGFAKLTMAESVALSRSTKLSTAQKASPGNWTEPQSTAQ